MVARWRFSNPSERRESPWLPTCTSVFADPGHAFGALPHAVFLGDGCWFRRFPQIGISIRFKTIFAGVVLQALFHIVLFRSVAVTSFRRRHVGTFRCFYLEMCVCKSCMGSSFTAYVASGFRQSLQNMAHA